ncbi:ATP-binding protein [Ktedonospora formicarum]|uniref:histidine kinase n=1 Tax=Ktedonospora formicarum TaxID=2778364 RepID=A0A8J3HVS9_9CHLR|nr:ATP-binding protein [Ktedonospora formicarum]GHO42916.1 hypothetical protein KSX_10790 [Ktedonospora formicarum]
MLCNESNHQAKLSGVQAAGKRQPMELVPAMQLEPILEHLSSGVALLDAQTLHIRYVNAYLRALLSDPWDSYQELRGHHLREVIPEEVFLRALPLLQEVANTNQAQHYAEVPYEGLLEIRGRTYWRISLEHVQIAFEGQDNVPTLLVTLEDVTERARSRLHLHAIHTISTAIAGPTALPRVLDRILQALHEMIGAKRCAILLTEQATHKGEPFDIQSNKHTQQTIHIVARQGIHPTSYEWGSREDEHTLFNQVAQSGHALIVPNTNTQPELYLPYIDDHGTACRPGSVLCVPIHIPYEGNDHISIAHERQPTSSTLGTIEVYHKRARGFPSEEVQLLERFAQQAGLAIHNARLFRDVENWARTANRHAHQQEKMMSAIPDGIVIFDPHWQVVGANPAARMLFDWDDEITGLSLQQLVKRSAPILPLSITEKPDFVTILEERAQKRASDEMKLINSEGRAYTLRCSYTPIPDEQENIFAYIIVYHDVTEGAAALERIEAEVIKRTRELAQHNIALQQSKAEQELTNARLQLLLKRMPSGVLLVDAPHTTINLINRRGVQLLQKMGAPLEPLDDPDLAAQQALGLECDTLLHNLAMHDSSGRLVPYEERPMHLALFKGQASEAELSLILEDGSIMCLLINAAPMLSAGGTITSAVVVMHDISRTKALERTREDLFNTMAHELKTPLANIRAHLSALLTPDLRVTQEEQMNYLQTADEQVERLVGMVNHFLDASRVEAGALRLDREPIIIPELFEDLQERLEALISDSQIQLQILLPEELPAVDGDYELLMSVLTNLLSNAFNYAPDGDIIQLEAKIARGGKGRRGPGVTLRVTDHGPGMSAEKQKAIFQRFYTFSSMSTRSQESLTLPRKRGSARWSPGTGLGLYISRGIIEAHGSKLTLKTSPGQGASFAFTLPVHAAHEPQK